MKKFKVFAVTLPVELVEEVRLFVGKREFSKLVRKLLTDFKEKEKVNKIIEVEANE